MRLLNVQSLEFHESYPPIPKYAIASHRWKEGTEATTKDVRDKHNTDKEGYRKVIGFAEYVKAHLPHVEWLWIDTCCINQDSDRELSEAINSMFKWYRDAEVCLVYLADVEGTDDVDCFKRSDWFFRGWTLQELLAPRTVIFLNKDWQVIGHKGGDGLGRSGAEIRTGPSLETTVAAVTGTPQCVLRDFSQSGSFTIQEKLRWIAGRKTMREEDMSYSLLGIFDLTMSIRYGEGGEKARRRLLSKIRKETENGQQQLMLAQLNGDTPLKPSSNVPYRRDLDFVDRGALMDRMNQRLALPAGRVALVGLGGAGKSQLAIEYAYRVREHSPQKWLFWIHASNAARFEQGIREIANEAKIDGRNDANADNFHLVHTWLRERVNGPWVVVLDNVDDASFLVERRAASEMARGDSNTSRALFDCIPVSEHGSVLITSRSKNAALKLVEHSDMIEVNPMDRETALAVLEKKLGKQDDEKTASELVETLEYMPLAITQAAAYIKRRGLRCSVQQYMEKLRKSDRSKQSILDVDEGDLRRDGSARNSIILTWQISFDYIYDTRRSAADLLALMSFCDGQSIPEALVRMRSREYDSGVPDSYVEVNLPDQESLSRSESDPDDEFDDEFDDDLAMLEGFSFVSVTTAISVFEMHGLVQLAMRKWLESHGQLEQWSNQYIDNLYALFPTSNYENWSTCQIYYPHTQSAAELKPKQEQALLKWATIMHKAASYAWQRINARDAETLAMLSFKARVKTLGEHDVATLASQGLLALAMKDQGRWKEAETLELVRMEISKEFLGAEHPDTLSSMGNLAVTYSNQGRYKEAEILEAQEMGIRKRVQGLEHPQTLLSINNLASTYWDQGRYSEAERLQVQVLEIRKRVLGLEHPNTIQSITNLATIYCSQGQHSEAEILETQVLEMRKRILGLEHPDTLTSMHNLASIYRGQRRYSEAEMLEAQVVETMGRVLGPEHPDTLMSKNTLVLIYRDQGRYSDAERLLVQVLETRKKVLGLEHPNTLDSMTNLAVIYQDQERYSEAETLEAKVLETSKRVLGEEHPSTLISLGNLAITYRDQRRLEEAEILQVQVLETRKKVLGVEHPDTLISLGNLAIIYRDQGKLEDAEILQVQVVETNKKVLGVEHPDTLSSISNFATIYRYQGRLKKAETLERQVLETRKRILGAEHPDILESIGNLATVYRHQGRLEEAEILAGQVLETKKKVLGAEHPDTLKSMDNLATIYWDQGRLLEAEALCGETDKLKVKEREAREKMLGAEDSETLKKTD